MDGYGYSARTRRAPQLTRHLRALTLIGPIQRLEDNKRLLRLEKAAVLEAVDMRYLALAAIEFLIERMGSGEAGRRDDLLEDLAGLVRRSAADASQTDAGTIADYVFGGLTNERERRVRFSARLYDPSVPDGVRLEFALVRAEVLPDNTVGWRLTQEAMEIHLSLLAHDPMTAQQVNELVVQEFLSRGLYDQAVHAAERTRTNSIRLADAIRQIMAEAKRAIRQVLWQADLGPRINEARTLLETSVAREGAILAHLGEAAADLDDEADRIRIAKVRGLLLDVQDRNRDLLVVTQKTADEYLAIQAEAIRLRRQTRLPSLEQGILDPLLKGPIAVVGAHRDAVFAALSAPLAPMVLDLGRMIEAFTPDPERDAPPPEEDMEIEDPSAPPPLPFDDAMIARAEDFARGLIRARGAMTMEAMLREAEARHPEERDFQRCLFLVLEQHLDARTGDVAKGSVIRAERFDLGFVRGTDVLYTDRPDGDIHAAE